MPHAPKPAIHVVAGALVSLQGQILIAQRPIGKHMAGGWEFPGGKIDSGETPLAALRRELEEELGIEVQAAEYLVSCDHEYPDRVVYLELWLVTEFTGEPKPLDHQALRWVDVDQLATANLLPADQPLIEALVGKLG
jgi:8-oxo-dGTP diphosphatase